MAKKQSKIPTGRKAISPERAEMYQERREAKRERTAYLRNARLAKQVRTGALVLPGL